MVEQNKDPGRESITPIAFEPPGAAHPIRARLLRPVPLIIAVLLALGLTVIWFLVAARSLTIAVEPPSAEVSVSGFPVISLADRYLLRPGDYQVRALAEGYREKTLTLTVTDQDYQHLDLALEKKPGHLVVTSDPPGAEVALDGESRGNTPLTLENISPGRHQLSLSHPRYFSQTLAVDVEGRDITHELALLLEPAWGHITLDSDPPGAEIRVGDRVAGTTPATVAVLAEGEEVTLRLPGYKPWQKTLRVDAGETLALDPILLEPADAQVQVSSTPTGATVTVNGDYRGRTPLTLALAPGDSRLAFFLDGYRTEERSLSLDSGEERSLNVDLQPNLGTVRVSTDPAGASIYVDGERRGSDGDLLKLPARPHKIEARKDGYAPASKTVTPRGDLEQTVRFDLLTEEEARWRNTPRRITSPAGQSLKLFRPEVTFTMGSSRREQGRRANEVQKAVTLSRPFYLATTEVTNAQYKQFNRRHSSSHADGKTLDRPQQPVVNVSWQDAARYCNWLSEQAGLTPFYTEKDGDITGHNADANGYRLPTEAEWSWAARVEADGSVRRFAWGEDFPPPDKAANIADNSAAGIVGRIVRGYRDGHATSSPVDAFAANDKGLHDLGHNVAEWVHDYYGIEPTLGGKTLKDPLGPEAGEFRVIRGASWRHGTLTELRLTFRDYGLDARDDLGFRIARYLD